MAVMNAQAHIWGAETPKRPWPSSGTTLTLHPPRLGKDELLRDMDAVGVDRAIIVPPSWEGDRNDLAMEAALLHSDRLAVMGKFAIERPESRSLVDTWKCQPSILGVRLTFHRDAYRTWLTDGTADWFWVAAEHVGSAVMGFAPGLLLQLATVAARHSGLRLVLDHLALSGNIKGAALGPTLKPALELAQYSHIAVKALSLPSYVTEAYPYPSLHAHIRRVVEAYGPHRVFRGIDLTRPRGSYCQAVTPLTEERDCLSDIDKTWIMGCGIGRMARLAAIGKTPHYRRERSLMETERPIPQPITPESKPYWDGMKEGKLMLPKCQDCGKAHFYPRVFCPHCHSNNLTWVQGSGKGKLYSFEILYRPFNRAVKVAPPYVLAMVELEEGPRMLSNLVNVEPDPKVIKCDMPVEIVFSKLTDDMTIPLFQPAR